MPLKPLFDLCPSLHDWFRPPKKLGDREAVGWPRRPSPAGPSSPVEPFHASGLGCSNPSPSTPPMPRLEHRMLRQPWPPACGSWWSRLLSSLQQWAAPAPWSTTRRLDLSQGHLRWACPPAPDQPRPSPSHLVSSTTQATSKGWLEAWLSGVDQSCIVGTRPSTRNNLGCLIKDAGGEGRCGQSFGAVWNVAISDSKKKGSTMII